MLIGLSEVHVLVWIQLHSMYDSELCMGESYDHSPYLLCCSRGWENSGMPVQRLFRLLKTSLVETRSVLNAV